jgi:diguanylate cyclase (GGDEF)-like protein
MVRSRVPAAAAWIGSVTAADLVVGEAVFLPSLLAVAPVVAATRARVRGTGAVVLAAVLAALLLGIPHRNFADPEHAVAVAVVLVVGGLAVWISGQQGQLRAALRLAEERAVVDGLTGVLTRRALLERAEELARLRSEVRPSLTVIMLDVDHFKDFNDRHGHQFGDEVLVGIASMLRTALRDGDLIGRYGGEEFIAVLVGGSRSEAHAIAHRLLETVHSTMIATSGGSLRVTLSAGLASVDNGSSGIAEAIRRADRALYASKEAGRARCTVWVAAGSEPRGVSLPG